MSVEIITNNNSYKHLAAIRQLFKESDTVTIAVAFLKISGLKCIEDILNTSLIAGASVKIVCGLDFYLTEPAALLKLHKLSEKYSNFQLRIYKSANSSTFHPKIYLGEWATNAKILIGSANLTFGGLKDNSECSIILDVLKTSSIFKEVKNILNQMSSDSGKGTLLSILQYQTYYNNHNAARKKLAESLESTTSVFDYNTLKSWLIGYRMQNNVDEIFARKSRHYNQAKVVLDTIANEEKLTTSRFIPLFEKLVGSRTENALWHSGSIFRMKTKVFNHPKAFQQLVRYIRTNKNNSPSVVFEGAKQLVAIIEGSGINTITEIMMTYNRARFANLNKNPITVLREEGGVSLKAHRNSFTGEDYEMYCNLVTEISLQLGLRNMLEADSLFNDIYWQIPH